MFVWIARFQILSAFAIIVDPGREDHVVPGDRAAEEGDDDDSDGQVELEGKHISSLEPEAMKDKSIARAVIAQGDLPERLPVELTIPI